MVMKITGAPMLVVMGVAGTGKSTVARLLAQRLNWEF
jgi:shikimate kinase